MFKVFLILSLATFAFSDDLSCYDCDPNTPGKCEKPDKSIVKETLCKDLLEKNLQSLGARAFSTTHQKTTLEPKSANIEQKFVHDCITLKYVPSPGSDLQEFPEGIYRGCLTRREHETSDPCKAATASILEKSNGNVTDCSDCRTSLCNRGKEGTGGAASFSLSGIAILSALVCFYLADF